jgi:hypothetical protein
MLSLLPLLLALAVDPSPAATLAPAAPTPLTEIGHTHALPVCTTIVAHANGAISAALEDDRGLAVLAANLRATDFDKLNDLQRHNAIEALLNQATAVRLGAHGAYDEIKRLREYAQTSSDETRKAELKAFADALGGALARQDKAAADFVGSVTVMNGRQDRADVAAITDASNMNSATTAQQQVAYTQQQQFHGGIAPPVQPGEFDKVFAQIGAALNERTAGILHDEGVAADHSLGATTGC